MGPGLSQGWTCLRAGLVSRQDLSLGRTCPSTLGPDLSRSWTCLRAGLVSGPDLSWGQKLQGRKCFTARSVQKCLGAGNVPKFRAGSVSRSDLVRGRKCLGAKNLPCMLIFNNKTAYVIVLKTLFLFEKI